MMRICFVEDDEEDAVMSGDGTSFVWEWFFEGIVSILFRYSSNCYSWSYHICQMAKAALCVGMHVMVSILLWTAIFCTRKMLGMKNSSLHPCNIRWHMFEAYLKRRKWLHLHLLKLEGVAFWMKMTRCACATLCTVSFDAVDSESWGETVTELSLLISYRIDLVESEVSVVPKPGT